MGGTDSQNLTILLTDIKEFTAKTSRKSRADILRMLDKHKELVLPILEHDGGRLIKTIGDAFLMVFTSPTDAVLAGIRVQDQLTAYNQDKTGDDRIDVRIAINAGEVTISDGDIFGDPVNITARIEAIAEAGEVYFTEAVYLAMNKKEVPSAELGLLQLKGIPEKVRVYKVRREQPVEELPPRRPGESDESAPASLAAPINVGKAAHPISRTSTPAPAGFKGKLRRLGALIIDIILVGIVTGILSGGDKNASRSNSTATIDRHAADIHGLKDDLIDREHELKRLEKERHVLKTKIHHESSQGENGNTEGLVAEAHELEREQEAVTAEMRGLATRREELQRALRAARNENSPKKKDGPFPIFWLLIHSLCLWKWSTTLGGKVMRLRVVTFDSGEPLDWKLAILRTLMTFVSTPLFLLGWAWALWEKNGRGWHDLIIGTHVVDAA